MVLGEREKIVKSVEPNIVEFSSNDKVIKANKKKYEKEEIVVKNSVKNLKA